MKHQIILLGGQLLPAYLGIKEFNPDKIHFIVSDESKDKITSLNTFLAAKDFVEVSCNPFDFSSIKSALSFILAAARQGDSFEINLTGGTKIMLLAAYSVLQESDLKGFYINPNNTVLMLPSFIQQNLNSKVTSDEFFEISGHKMLSRKKLLDFDNNDFSAALNIQEFADKNILDFESIIKFLRKNYNDANKKIPKEGFVEINKRLKFRWTANSVSVTHNSAEILLVESERIRSLFFNSEWWEIIVAKEVSKWSKISELYIQCELPFKDDEKVPKNEIDVLINSGNKLMFIECKSGNVKADDINKMKVIKDLYGGIISKSLLVCRFLPDKKILEKCKELSIDVFYLFNGNTLVNNVAKLTQTLDDMDGRLNI